MIRNIILFLGLCALLALAACTVTSDQPEMVDPPVVETVQTSAGPYAVNFDPATNTYAHNFTINLHQSEGKVDYYISPLTSTDITIEAAQSGVVGCPASQVTHQMFWAYDHRNPLEGRFVFVGSVIRAYAGYKGVLTHTFRRLLGCRSLELNMKLKK